MKNSAPWRIVVLAVVLVGVALAYAYLYGGLGGGDAADGTADSVTGAPANVARDPRAARDYAVGATCRANCTSADQMCRGTAMSPEETARCADTLRACQSACGR